MASQYKFNPNLPIKHNGKVLKVEADEPEKGKVDLTLGLALEKALVAPNPNLSKIKSNSYASLSGKISLAQSSFFVNDKGIEALLEAVEHCWRTYPIFFSAINTILENARDKKVDVEDYGFEEVEEEKKA